MPAPSHTFRASYTLYPPSPTITTSTPQAHTHTHISHADPSPPSHLCPTSQLVPPLPPPPSHPSRYTLLPQRQRQRQRQPHWALRSLTKASSHTHEQTYPHVRPLPPARAGPLGKAHSDPTYICNNMLNIQFRVDVYSIMSSLHCWPCPSVEPPRRTSCGPWGPPWPAGAPAGCARDPVSA